MRASQRLMSSLRVAVLHQGAPVPPVGGVVKPMKPGGYADSSADIAYALRCKGVVDVVTPTPKPEATRDLDWSFPDTVSSVRSAVSEHGVNVFWANTILHSKHSLVELSDFLISKDVRIVGQNPLDTEKFDDKEWLNRWLAQQAGLQGCFPRSHLLTKADMLDLGRVRLPAVVKPVRGRGSHGVKVVHSVEELTAGLEGLLKESDAVLCEEYLEGEETTITIMPPGKYSIGIKDKHWALPVVTRFDQVDGVAPWNGTVPVIANSRALSEAEHDNDPEYGIAQRKCELVAELCRATAPMRIDCRRRREGGEIILFDVNMKPNATGLGRPGRENQTSLVAMAAEAMGWNFQELCVETLQQARPLKELLSP